jgi:hypothetical protein
MVKNISINSNIIFTDIRAVLMFIGPGQSSTLEAPNYTTNHMNKM